MMDEPLYPSVEILDWEKKLFEKKALRRLKHLAHFGAGALISPVVHSRLDHTFGVWKLAAHFFPEDHLLRAAAILHDVGHIPFSHSAEKFLGFDHHQLTEKIICTKEIKECLREGDLSSQTIIDYLNQKTVLTGKNQNLGLDHLESFLRDTYMCGTALRFPKEVLMSLNCTETGIDTEQETAEYIMTLILHDHQYFLSPKMIAVDRLIAEAIHLHWEEVGDPLNKEAFAYKTDVDLLGELLSSPSKRTREITQTILYQPSKMCIRSGGNGYPIEIRKIYSDVPFVNGESVVTKSVKAKKMFEELHDLSFQLYVSI